MLLFVKPILFPLNSPERGPSFLQYSHIPYVISQVTLSYFLCLNICVCYKIINHTWRALNFIHLGLLQRQHRVQQIIRSQHLLSEWMNCQTILSWRRVPWLLKSKQSIYHKSPVFTHTFFSPFSPPHLDKIKKNAFFTQFPPHTCTFSAWKWQRKPVGSRRASITFTTRTEDFP